MGGSEFVWNIEDEDLILQWAQHYKPKNFDHTRSPEASNLTDLILIWYAMTEAPQVDLL